MRKYMAVFTILFIFFSLVPVPPIVVSADNNVSDFKMTTKNSTNFTEAKIKEYVKARNPNSPMLGHEKELIKASESYGINGAFVLGQWQGETQLGLKTCMGSGATYNLGCIKARSDYPSVNGWSNPKDMPAGIDFVLKYLKEDYIDIGKTTVQQMLDKYAPSSDNNDHTLYKTVIKESLDFFDTDLNGEGMTPNSPKEDRDEKTKEVQGIPDPELVFEPRLYTDIQVGVNDGGDISQNMVMAANKWSNLLLENVYIIASFFVVTMLFYVSIGVSLFVIGYKGFYAPKLEALANKVIGKDITYDHQGALQLMLRILKAVIMLTVILSGVYVIMMKLILQLLGTL